MSRKDSIPDSRVRLTGTFASMACPTSTPWGGSQHTDILAWGNYDKAGPIPILWQVHTAGHGGTRVHPELAARYFKTLPSQCFAYGGSRLWFEEDCESAVPLFIFYNALAPECWLVNGDKPYPRMELLSSVKRWLPETLPHVIAIARLVDGHVIASGNSLRQPIMDAEITLPAPMPPAAAH